MWDEKADWVSWTLQFIVGLMLGAVIGVLVMTRGGFSTGGEVFWMDRDAVVWFILGSTILGGALLSYYGECFYDRNGRFGIFPINPPSKSAANSRWSTIMAFFGLVCVCLSLILQFSLV